MISEYIQAALNETEYDWMGEEGEYFATLSSLTERYPDRYEDVPTLTDANGRDRALQAWLRETTNARREDHVRQA